MGYVKQTQGVQKKPKFQIVRGPYKAAVTVGPIPKPSVVGGREL